MKRESGDLVPYSDPTFDHPQRMTDRDHGTHSGDRHCMMTYHAATAYTSRADPSVRYMFDVAPLGSELCTSPLGTEFNAPTYLPQSRFGDAAPRRGNCTAKLCINDRFRDTPEHERGAP